MFYIMNIFYYAVCLDSSAPLCDQLNNLEFYIESSYHLADEKEVSLQSALKEFTIVVEIVASLRREYLIFILWKLLLEPHGNKLTN